MKKWYIYKTTNLLSGKSYVGQRSVLKDKNSLLDSYLGSGTHIKRSIKTHGVKSFKKEILKDNINCQTVANLLEETYIKKENTLSPFGYNLRSSCMQNSMTSEETKQKISKTLTGHEVSKETRTKLSKAHRGRVSNHKGHKHSEEFKKQMSKIHKGKIISEETKLKRLKSRLGMKYKKRAIVG